MVEIAPELRARLAIDAVMVVHHPRDARQAAQRHQRGVRRDDEIAFAMRFEAQLIVAGEVLP